MSRASTAFHLIATLGLGATLVATPLPFNFAAFVVWAVFVTGWVTRRGRAGGRRAGGAELVVQLGAMSLLVLAATAAPGKVVDRMKARRFTVPKPAMTLGQLQEPQTSDANPPIRYQISAPDDWAGRVVRCPTRTPTVGEFIAAVEAQTPLRHRFGHCGNGWTVLWGGDCSFGLRLRVPTR